MSEQVFPVLFQGDREYITQLRALNCPRSVPWAFIEKYRSGCIAHHGQTPERLAERGGLGPEEIIALIDGAANRAEQTRRWAMRPEESVPRLVALVNEWTKAQGQFCPNGLTPLAQAISSLGTELRLRTDERDAARSDALKAEAERDKAQAAIAELHAASSDAFTRFLPHAQHPAGPEETEAIRRWHRSLEIVNPGDGWLSPEAAEQNRNPCQSCGANPTHSPPSGQELPVVRGALDAQEEADRRAFAAEKRATEAEAKSAALYEALITLHPPDRHDCDELACRFNTGEGDHCDFCRILNSALSADAGKLAAEVLNTAAKYELARGADSEATSADIDALEASLCRAVRARRVPR